MKQIFCPDTAIVENKDTTVSQKCTIFTNDESVVTLIQPKAFPAIGQPITKDAYYIKEGELMKATASTIVTKDTVLIQVATEKINIKMVEEVPIEEKPAEEIITKK